MRSSSAAHNPIPSKVRMASERDKMSGSPRRHSSIPSSHSGWSLRLMTAVCPVRGRPRFFRITTFESDMRHVLHSSMSSRHSSCRRRLKTGICPIRGRPRYRGPAWACLTTRCTRRESTLVDLLYYENTSFPRQRRMERGPELIRGCESRLGIFLLRYQWDKGARG